MCLVSLCAPYFPSCRFFSKAEEEGVQPQHILQQHASSVNLLSGLVSPHVTGVQDLEGSSCTFLRALLSNPFSPPAVLNAAGVSAPLTLQHVDLNKCFLTRPPNHLCCRWATNQCMLTAVADSDDAVFAMHAQDSVHDCKWNGRAARF